MIKITLPIMSMQNIKSLILYWTSSTSCKKIHRNQDHEPVSGWLYYILSQLNPANTSAGEDTSCGYLKRITVTCENNHKPVVTPNKCEFFTEKKNREEECRLKYELVERNYQVSSCINDNGSAIIWSHPFGYI